MLEVDKLLKGLEPTRSANGRPNRVSPYDASTGLLGAGNVTTLVMGGSSGMSGEIRDQGGLQTVFGDDAWKWMLIGPVAASD